MSIYSGFATRQQERTYNELVKMLIELLSQKALKNLEGAEITEEDEILWKRRIMAIHKKMAYMEQNKYLKPHLSYCFDGLAIRIREEIHDDQSIAIIKSNYGSDDDKPPKRSPSTKIKENVFGKPIGMSLIRSEKAGTITAYKRKIKPGKYNTKKPADKRELNNQTAPCFKSAKKKTLKHIKIEVSELKVKSQKKKKKQAKQGLL